MHRSGIEPESTTWQAAMLTIAPAMLGEKVSSQGHVSLQFSQLHLQRE